MDNNRSNTATAQPPRNFSSDRSQGGGARGGRRPDRSRGPAPVEEKQFDERTLHIDRVARVVKGGRRFRFRALVVAGDKKGRIGVGIAKGADVTAAVAKATDIAKKTMITVPMYKGTLPHEVQAKVGGANILLMPASAGTGLIAGSVVRTMLEVAGISNALSKSLGSSNKTNTAYAVLEALQQIVPAKRWTTSIRHGGSTESKNAPTTAALSTDAATLTVDAPIEGDAS